MDGTRYSPADLMRLMDIPQSDIDLLKSPEHLGRYSAYASLDDYTHQDARAAIDDGPKKSSNSEEPK